MRMQIKICGDGFCIAREAYMPKCCPIIQEEARLNIEKVGRDNFSSSNNWLEL